MMITSLYLSSSVMGVSINLTEKILSKIFTLPINYPRVSDLKSYPTMEDWDIEDAQSHLTNNPHLDSKIKLQARLLTLDNYILHLISQFNLMPQVGH